MKRAKLIALLSAICITTAPVIAAPVLNYVSSVIIAYSFVLTVLVLSFTSSVNLPDVELYFLKGTCGGVYV